MQPDSDVTPLAAIKIHSSSPPFPPRTTPHATETPTANAKRRIGIAVDLSDESAFAVKWAIHHYIRLGDAVILVHVRPTSVVTENEESQRKLDDDFDTFTTTKMSDLSQPLMDAQIPYKIHIVKDHDVKERLCLEAETLGLSAVITGSDGSVSDHCVCPVVVVRYPNEKPEASDGRKGKLVAWAPTWKDIEESPQYKCGMLCSYLREWKLEKYDHIDDSEYPPTIYGYRAKNNHRNLKRFLKQVRESRGYDVDCRPPSFMHSPFCPRVVNKLMNSELTRRSLTSKINFVVGKINTEAEMYGERYELQEIQKVVDALPHRMTLLTFSVREVSSMVIKTVQAMVYTKVYHNHELREWRFKPEE